MVIKHKKEWGEFLDAVIFLSLIIIDLPYIRLRKKVLSIDIYYRGDPDWGLLEVYRTCERQIYTSNRSHQRCSKKKDYHEYQND